MTKVRAFIRLILFFIISFLTVLLVAVGNPVLELISHRWTVIWKNKVIRSWAFATGWLIGMKVNVKGKPPKAPFFLVSNHLSYIDTLLLWRYLDATFVAKSEIKSWPFFGWGTRTLGVLFIDRELKRDVHRMNQRISSSISNEQGVILFPEGTSTRGSQVMAFNASLLQYAVDSKTPVDFATISYKTHGECSAHLKVCWWGDMPFFSHFWELLKMPGFEATLIFGDKKITGADRKNLAAELQEAVSQNFSPVVEEQTA